MMKFILAVVLLITASIVSANEKGLIRKQATESFVTGNKVAILVGVGDYNLENTGFSQLSYAARDVEVLAKTLSAKGYEVIKITDQNASKAVILNRIEQVANLIKPNQGTLLFAFSGHGWALPGQPTRLATFDAIAHKLDSTGLSVQDVVSTIRNTGVKRAMLFIDACRNNPTPIKSGPVAGPRHYNPGKGIQILYSTQKANVSIEHPSIAQGVFSYFVNRGLLGEAEDQGVVTFASLARYVEREVPRWSNRHTPIAQQPFRTVDGEHYGDFVLAARSVADNRADSHSHTHGRRSHAHPLPVTGLNHRHGAGPVAQSDTKPIVIPVAPVLAPSQTVQTPLQTNSDLSYPEKWEEMAGNTCEQKPWGCFSLRYTEECDMACAEEVATLLQEKLQAKVSVTRVGVSRGPAGCVGYRTDQDIGGSFKMAKFVADVLGDGYYVNRHKCSVDGAPIIVQAKKLTLTK